MNQELKTEPLKSPLQLKGKARELKELQDILNLHARAMDEKHDPLAPLPKPIPAPVCSPERCQCPAPVADTPPAALASSSIPVPMEAGEDIAPAPSKVDHSRLFFTGRLMSGKDFCAAYAGAYVESFAKPLYFLLEHFFGVSEADKDKGRQFLQTAGQWGRGHLSEKYPLTPERAAFVAAIRAESKRANFPSNLGVDWEAFGRRPNLWLDAALLRTNQFISSNPGRRVALTNVRFTNEYTMLKNIGWSGWHVMCSPQTWAMRLAMKKFNQNSPEVQDESEGLAAGIDRKVFTAIRSKQGPRLKVIWSDEKQPPISTRLHTVESFGGIIGKGGPA